MSEIGKIVSLPIKKDRRGNLSFIEQTKHIPFRIKRVFWIYDVPGGQKRGGHAYYNQQEFIIALSGSFDVLLNDGEKEEVVQLNRSYYGLYVPNLVWREMINFSTNAVALVLSSSLYNVNDYIRDFEVYSKIKKNGKINSI